MTPRLGTDQKEPCATRGGTFAILPIHGNNPGHAGKPWIVLFFKLSLTGGLLWATLRKVPMHGILAALGRVQLGSAALSVGVFLFGTLALESARLSMAGRLLCERQPRYLQWLRIFAESRPFFYLLPGAVAAEGMVWLRLRRLQWRHGSCGYVLVSTRVWGVAFWGFAAAYALTFRRGAGAILAQLPAWVRSPSVWACGAILVTGCIALAPNLMGRLNRVEVRPSVALPNLAMALGALASVFLGTLSAMIASSAAGTPLPWHGAMGLMALFNFAMVLPISLGGFGLQEALVLLLGLSLGYPAPALVAFSALLHLQRLALSLAGLGVFLGGRRSSLPAPVAI